MKKIVCAALLAALVKPAFAGRDPLDQWFTGKDPVLTKQEQAALNLVRQWENISQKSKPIQGPNGDLQFVYGRQAVTILCAPLQICDLALQPGEELNSLNTGDSVRWLIEPAVSGSGENETIHLLIKPTDVGLDTSMVITTNFRSYHIKLRSSKKRYMPKISFIYPELLEAKLDLIKNRHQMEREKRIFPGTEGKTAEELDFNYSIRGKAPWKPVRVYNDGRSTIIQMPKRMQQTEAPVLLVIRESGSMFKKDENVIVNNRLQGDRFIVDEVFHKAILVAGVGRTQKKITITHEGK